VTLRVDLADRGRPAWQVSKKARLLAGVASRFYIRIWAESKLYRHGEQVLPVEPFPKMELNQRVTAAASALDSGVFLFCCLECPGHTGRIVGNAEAPASV
jgi:hypothetical protein